MFTDLIRRIKAGSQHFDPADAIEAAGRHELQTAIATRAQARRTLVPQDGDNADAATPQGPDRAR